MGICLNFIPVSQAHLQKDCLLSNITYRPLDSPQPNDLPGNIMNHSRRSTYLIFIACSLVAALFISTATPASPDGLTPEDTIGRFNAALLDAMKKADALGYKGRYQLLEPVITDVFALSFMASKAMGSHWRKLTPKQRGIYLKTYSDWTVATYAGRFDGYSGEIFDIARSVPADRDTVSVKSSIMKPNGDRIVDFKYLLRRMSGKWQIIDIRIVEVSQLALTRAQFVSVMNKEGFDNLISMLREKTKAFSVKRKE
jgi:phospholipid transport system substrate-binding protein